MENIVVGTIVGLAAVWGGIRLFAKRKAASCGSGCDGCHCSSKPQPLVTLKR